LLMTELFMALVAVCLTLLFWRKRYLG
jgi:hypothetical protein